ncbi:type II secretion system F family protein [Aneurinibacillus sp. Ricciae_BoGa-3]|uniref:type II secretion system F family protein n=1 Tax=Aneurinibacillus sp. Ricciae_BoGa-3 TaxID=3022697 RepID=UPI0023419552|nr:type II secretion system F family protein [Aneurinibacillus sp. Ricciae_BoGa-3]WCK53352.1 type II secretion system F family protein [Aneurinibacillus sp. Ricciae_BoGa-3]
MNFSFIQHMNVKIPWSDHNLPRLSHHLSYLLEAGIPLLESLSLTTEHFSGKERRQLLVVRSQLEEGQALSRAMGYMTVPPLFVSLLVAGEQHGEYASSFSFASRYYRERAEWKQKISQLIVYPFVLLCLSLASLWFLFDFILPQIGEMYSTLNIALPLITRIVIRVFSFLSSYGLSLVCLLICAVGLIALFHKMKKFALAVSSVLFYLPYSSQWMKIKYSHYFSMQAGLLLEAGISILDICLLFQHMAPWPLYRQLMARCEQGLREGEPLSRMLKASASFFTWEIVKYTELGEEGGQVGQCLIFYSQQAEEERKRKIERLIRLLEPLLLLTIGSLVLVVVLSFFLPVLHMVNSLNE